jgi:hypothetical protein
MIFVTEYEEVLRRSRERQRTNLILKPSKLLVVVHGL